MWLTPISSSQQLPGRRHLEAHRVVVPFELAADVDAAPPLAVPGPPEREERGVVEDVAEERRAPVEQHDSPLVGEHVDVEEVVVHQMAVLRAEGRELPHVGEARVGRGAADRRRREPPPLRGALAGRILEHEGVVPAAVLAACVAVPEAVARRAGEIRLSQRVHRREQRRQDPPHPVRAEVVDRSSAHPLRDAVGARLQVADLDDPRRAQCRRDPALRVAVLLEIAAALVEAGHVGAAVLDERERGGPLAAPKRHEVARVVTACAQQVPSLGGGEDDGHRAEIRGCRRRSGAKSS